MKFLVSTIINLLGVKVKGFTKNNNENPITIFVITIKL